VGFWILILWDDKIEEYFWILKSMSVDRLVPGLSFKQNARFLEFVGPREKLEAPSDKEVYEGTVSKLAPENHMLTGCILLNCG
jgi:hypothetical protein